VKNNSGDPLVPDPPVDKKSELVRRSFWQRRGSLLLECALVLVVCLWGSLWHYQGWESFRLKNHDMIIYHENADRLLQQGVLPALGDTSSYLSVSPPGTSYWVALAKLATSDPRWQEFIPEIALFFLELLFAWLLIRTVLNKTVAAMAVVGIGISRFGFLGLWPIGNAAYVLGAAYFLVLWARDRTPWAIAAAIGWFGFGALVDLAILPAVILFPVVWIYYRPPWKTIWGLVGMLGVLVIWFPYLGWESQHGFQDLSSLVNRQNVSDSSVPTDESGKYCNASLLGESGTWSGSYADWGFPDQGSRFVVYPGTSLLAKIRHRACQLGINLDRNFDGNFFAWGNWPAGNSILWVAWMAGAIGAGLVGARRFARFDAWMGEWKKRNRIRWFVASGILALLWILYFLLQASLLDTIASHWKGDWAGVLAQATGFLPALGVSLFLAVWISDWLSSMISRGFGILAGAIWISWFLLWMLAEPNVELRFWWAWPLQVICIVLAGFGIGRSIFHGQKWFALAIPLLACAALVPALFLEAQTVHWISEGYGGKDSGQLDVVDTIGRGSEGSDAASVGYQLLVLDYQPLFNRSHDMHHRAGSWFDYLLRSRWGLNNRNQTVTGLAPGDQYRILELPPPCTQDQVPQNSPWPEYRQADVFSCYVLYLKK
jgi:hypothetical protein